MNLYQTAILIKPDSLLDHSGKVIWKGNGFAYLFRIDNTVYLRMSFSIAQLAFYTLHNDGWKTVAENLYKEIVELWIIEKEQIGSIAVSGQSSYL